jgi:putative NADPH-quinone reductase
MNVFLVNAHAEPRSFNCALFRTAQNTRRTIESEQPIEAAEY